MRTYEQIKQQMSDMSDWESARSGVSYLESVCPTFQDSGCCTAIAMSALLDQDFDVSLYALMEVTGKRPGAFGWTPYLRTYAALGFDVIPQEEYTAKTVTTLERDPALSQGRFLISVSGGRHAVAMVDGKVIDWTEGRRYRIHKIWKIEEA